MKTLLQLFAFVAIAALLTGCGTKNDDSEADLKPRANVEVGQAVLGSIDNVVNSTGSFQVLRDERVKSTISGKIEKILVLEGDNVHKGQVLVTVLSQESNAAITGAEQLLSQATSVSDRARAQRALRIAESTAAVANITAPFTGAIIHRFVTEGELISQGSDLVELVDPDTKYFLANVPLHQVASIRKGQSVTVTVAAMNIPPLHGTVQAINSATDPGSQSVQVRIGLNSIPSIVSPGTFGDVSILVGRHNNAILVPKSAVYHDDELDRNIVWRIQGDSLALVTQVITGLANSMHVEILSGLRAGDVVATVGGYGLPDSTDVTIVRHEGAITQ